MSAELIFALLALAMIGLTIIAVGPLMIRGMRL